jgi:hypothetical protein
MLPRHFGPTPTPRNTLLEEAMRFGQCCNELKSYILRAATNEGNLNPYQQACLKTFKEIFEPLFTPQTRNAEIQNEPEVLQPSFVRRAPAPIQKPLRFQNIKPILSTCFHQYFYYLKETDFAKYKRIKVLMFGVWRKVPKNIKRGALIRRLTGQSNDIKLVLRVLTQFLEYDAETMYNRENKKHLLRRARFLLGTVKEVTAKNSETFCQMAPKSDEEF